MTNPYSTHSLSALHVPIARFLAVVQQQHHLSHNFIPLTIAAATSPRPTRVVPHCHSPTHRGPTTPSPHRALAAVGTLVHTTT
jgi:hypothetical protein